MKDLKLLFVFTLMLTCVFFSTAIAQDHTRYVRIVELMIDSTQLDHFKAALKEDIETAVRTEPSVLTLHAVYERENPVHVTVFEIYTNEAAHRLHMETVHYKKYRDITKDMIRSVVRREMIAIGLQTKPKL